MRIVYAQLNFLALSLIFLYLQIVRTKVQAFSLKDRKQHKFFLYKNEL